MSSSEILEPSLQLLAGFFFLQGAFDVEDPSIKGTRSVNFRDEAVWLLDVLDIFSRSEGLLKN